MTTCPFAPGFDFTDPDLIQQRIPAEEFAYLRNTEPIWWNAQPREWPDSTTTATG